MSSAAPSKAAVNSSAANGARQQGESPIASALRRVTKLLEELPTRPDLNFTLGDLQAWLPDISEQLLQAALRRLMAQNWVMRSSSHSSHWFAVPPELQYSSNLPLEIWLDHYFTKIACIPYYVGPLSAASLQSVPSPRVNDLQVMLPRVAARFCAASWDASARHGYRHRRRATRPARAAKVRQLLREQ